MDHHIFANSPSQGVLPGADAARTTPALQAALRLAVESVARQGGIVRFRLIGGELTAIVPILASLEEAAAMLPGNPTPKRVRRIAGDFGVPIVYSGKTPCINVRALHSRMQGLAA